MHQAWFEFQPLTLSHSQAHTKHRVTFKVLLLYFRIVCDGYFCGYKLQWVSSLKRSTLSRTYVDVLLVEELENPDLSRIGA